MIGKLWNLWRFDFAKVLVPRLVLFHNYLWANIKCFSLWRMLISHVLFSDSAWEKYFCAEHIRQSTYVYWLLNRIYEGNTTKCPPQFDPVYILIPSYMVLTGPFCISTSIPERNITRELYKFRTCLLLALCLVAVPTNETRPLIQLRMSRSWQVFNVGAV